MSIQIISATPGPTTTERILELVLTNHQGITVKELGQRLNRPVSMVQHCLRHLISSQAVGVRLSEDGRQWIYYPVLSKPEATTDIDREQRSKKKKQLCFLEATCSTMVVPSYASAITETQSL